MSVDAAGLRWHDETGIPLFSWSSQARGFFAGQFTPDIREGAGEAVGGFVGRMMAVYGTNENFERLRRAEELGREKGGYSAVQVALAWLLHQPVTVVPIVGPQSANELVSCVDALSIELTASEVKHLSG